MQFRICNSETSTASGSRFLKVSSAFFVASAVLLALPMTSDAFVPSSFSQPKTTSTQLFYTMPDVTSMKAKDMRQELESYGIKTHNFFDKREFEQALIEARRNYEQTLNDVMSSTRPKEKKTQARRKTVNYDRSQHRDERIYSSDVNDQPGQGTRYAEEQFHRQQTKQRRRTHYQAEPNPVGNFQRDFETYPNVNTGPQGGGGRRRPGNDWFEQDPLYDHEKQANGRDEHFARGREEHFEEEYTVGGNREPRVTYDDPAKEMKYQAALQYAYNMKVEDLQRELNCRGISTKYCMIVKDFCIEYAKAVVEGKEKNVEDPDENTFGEDDEDYDPAYRDVVMQKYDPSMWI